jgi:hypothetical protein
VTNVHIAAVRFCHKFKHVHQINTCPNTVGYVSCVQQLNPKCSEGEIHKHINIIYIRADEEEVVSIYRMTLGKREETVNRKRKQYRYASFNDGDMF